MITADIDRVNIYLYHQGMNFQSYKILGAHKMETGTRFSVWALNASEIFVIGDFNNWCGDANRMNKIEDSELWEIFIEGANEGDLYKYKIHTTDGRILIKADPYAFGAELRPRTASKITCIDDFCWQDNNWLSNRAEKNVYESPINIYEVHLSSWKNSGGEDSVSFRNIVDELSDYVKTMGYTHIELMPVNEYPYDGSWGYQGTGYFAITSRFGTPKDFMYFIDVFHSKGLGVIVDWVPGHFCKDEHGLYRFDGTPLYEYQQHMKAENYGWGTANFDLGRTEVKSFLISNAMFLFKHFHIDGLRIDAVANMLYLDYGRSSGNFIPNKFGGRENFEAIAFLRELNEAVFKSFPNALMIAEESTQYPMITAPTYLGGLGCNYKWNMGWMNDMLRYIQMDPIYKKWHHNLVTFSFFYAFSENFILPLSHDEVVHGKKSLLDKMPGNYHDKFANLRLLYGYMMCHPGKKLLFMGGEFGQFIEWRYDRELDWFLLEYPYHKKMQQYVKSLNHFYLRSRALWEQDLKPEGFDWIDPNNNSQSIIVFSRKGKKRRNVLIVVCNFTTETYRKYKMGVPFKCNYKEYFNSDKEEFGGFGNENEKIITYINEGWHNCSQHVEIMIPPLSMLALKPNISYKISNIKYRIKKLVTKL